MKQAYGLDEAPTGGGGTMADAPRVFISYSHDSDEHADRVLDLADALCAGGIDVRLDRYVHPAPAEGWPRWMAQNIEAARFVLLVCTDTYGVTPRLGKNCTLRADEEGWPKTSRREAFKFRRFRAILPFFRPEFRGHFRRKPFDHKGKPSFSTRKCSH